MPDNQPTKVCKICGERKSCSDFQARYRQCKQCRREKDRVWRESNKDIVRARRRLAYNKNPEKWRAYTAEWRRNNPERARAKVNEWHQENKGRLKEYRRQHYLENIASYRASRREYYHLNAEAAKRYSREWVAANPEKARMANRRWYVEHREQAKQTHREWYEKNRAAHQASTRSRKARQKNAEGKFSPRDILDIYRKQCGLCAACKVDIEPAYHIDHILPLVRGGTNWPGNIQLLCPTCNLSKGAKDPIVWAQENGRLF